LRKINAEEIFSDWRWLLDNQKHVVLVSSIGDMFLESNDGAIYWLDAGMGELTLAAENFELFQLLLEDEEAAANWFLPDLVDQLIQEGKVLKEDQVYSFKKPPILGGNFNTSNFEVTSISVHFSILGQIHKQIWDLPDGTSVNSVTIK